MFYARWCECQERVLAPLPVGQALKGLQMVAWGLSSGLTYLWPRLTVTEVGGRVQVGYGTQIRMSLFHCYGERWAALRGTNIAANLMISDI